MAVSYTHLDVYKRQAINSSTVTFFKRKIVLKDLFRVEHDSSPMSKDSNMRVDTE